MPQIRCNVCTAKFHQQENSVGKYLQCPKCGTRIKIKTRDQGPPRERVSPWRSYAIGFLFGFIAIAIIWALFAAL